MGAIPAGMLHALVSERGFSVEVQASEDVRGPFDAGHSKSSGESPSALIASRA